MPLTCSAIAKSGSRCSRPALAKKQHCLMHDGDSAELRREAGRKGGHARSNKSRAEKAMPDAMTPEELSRWLSQVFTAVITGAMEPKIGIAAAGIARTLMVVREMGELEERLTALEAQAGRRVM